MAYEVVIHDAALDALNSALEYLDLITGGPSSSRKLAQAFLRRADEIADNPSLYGLSRVPELANAGYHATLVGSYLMLYYLSGDTVHIAHFFHQSQDYARYVI